MSLLNDALRAAEERQNRPVAPGAYVGGAQPSRGGKGALVVVVVFALLVAGLATYWIVLRDTGPGDLAVVAEPEAGNELPEAVGDARPQLPQAVTEPGSLSVPEPAPKPEPARTDVVKVEPPSARAPEPGRKPEPKPESEPEQVSEPTQPSGTAANTVASQPPEREAPEPEPESDRVSTAGVKNVPQTPAARDRSEARELERLVTRGRMTEAESRLAALVRDQSAPRSRYVVARALLVDGKPDQALNWLPGDAAAQEPKLRLLRARALHADNDLAGALGTLTENVPPVEDHAEYRVTLATLLQQQGRSGEAARHWAELIAWDDSKGAWWVGLAISLEAQGEQAGAARAYQQAEELPGLPRSLADYVRQRLQALRAG